MRSLRCALLWLLLTYIQQTICSKQYVFQFDLKNKHDWDEYTITHDQRDDHEIATFHGAAHKCTSRMPQIFKKLCVAYSDRDGYRLSFESVDNLNVDPHFADLLWFYGDHATAQNAQKIAKAKYVDLNGALTEITPIVSETRRLLKRSSKLENARRCYSYGDAEACSHFHDSHPNLLTVSVALKDDDVNEDSDASSAAAVQAAQEQYADIQSYGDYGYYDEQDVEDVYNEDDMNAMYDVYQQYLLAQQLYNAQLANYLRDWNNNNNMAQNAMYSGFGDWYGANGYGYGDNNEYDMYYADSDEKENVDRQDEAGAIANGFGISEAAIMQRAEAEAKKHVEEKMEKKLEGKLEAEMMSHLNGGGGTEGYMPSVHKKHHQQNFEEGGETLGEDMQDKDGDGLDPEHSGMPMDELEEETDQNNVPPHDSLSAE
eukprot:CAMPEP_0202726370 /NCGR_PEP_ID=MMETSP1385-20130828/184576_1 /ASSEMBLY_ACC=CAM_ASM_000861 /TAXON_ID=933848 /ORGANISM="Elphidium margaritaceum" /LENGTH=428 /DNA_ID=CAMNT_0049392589 /DNA_START=36 /DNA_END=1322 /DNA_ORIENTATION=-